MAGVKPVVLCILDGWGLSDDRAANAPALADTPAFDRIWATCPHATLITHGPDVGLPKGQMGNSEVGHMNIGAGRVVAMDLGQIDLGVTGPLRLPLMGAGDYGLALGQIEMALSDPRLDAATTARLEAFHRSIENEGDAVDKLETRVALDLDDLCSQHRQQQGSLGPRPGPGEIGHPDPRERPLARASVLHQTTPAATRLARSWRE